MNFGRIKKPYNAVKTKLFPLFCEIIQKLRKFV